MHYPITIRKSITCFNPRPYVRGDVSVMLLSINSTKFQSAPLREGRCVETRFIFLSRGFQSAPLREGRCPNFRGALHINTGFNPRPYVRGDAKAPLTGPPIPRVSIRAPT